ncbi:PREDICTED: uncharacterized protein LOC107356692 [Acropora digitifera]|uniref:uncharacterized protein LOC107356692 n=1 Tax=Acropora digitifera TaxID=70779 RepID=UPI00077ABB10|nr:PREDICTED: uncharacterized protein LOC107356692 [Acropora digitifera]
MTCTCERCNQKRVIDCLFVKVDVNLHIARQTQLFLKINSLSPGTMAESCWESSSEEELLLTQSTFTVKSDEYDGMGVSTSEGNGKCLEDNAGISEGVLVVTREWKISCANLIEWRETKNENSDEPVLNQRIDELSE